MILNFSEELATFVVSTEYDDLPEMVRHEIKRVLLDSIGCALAGAACDKGRISVELARRFGGIPESSIIGMHGKTSSCNAAFANGELINALDYDCIIASHSPGEVIPPILALAESGGVSGEDLILATALGFEIAYRFNLGIVPSITQVEPKKAVEMGFDGAVLSKYQENWWRTLVKGQSMFLFGGTAGVGKILKLDHEKMIHALGIAGHLCPIPTNRKWSSTRAPGAMTKYGHSGFPSMAVVSACLLAQMGYQGDTTVFDGEYGFWRMYGAAKWEPDKALEKIGKDWFISRSTLFKPYPCVVGMHGALASFINIIVRNKILPEEIEYIKAFVDPTVTHWVLGEGLANHIDAQFNVPYCFACAAYRIPIGADWQTSDTMRDQRILEFMQKVSKEAAPDYSGREGKEWSIDRFISSGAAEVMARGKVFKEARMISRSSVNVKLNSGANPVHWMTDKELVDKFRHNALGVLPQIKIDEAVNCILHLEAVKNVNELMEQLTP